MRESQDSVQGFTEISWKTIPLRKYLKSPGDLLTHMEYYVSLGDERKVKEAEQDNKAQHLEEAVCTQLYVSWMEGGNVAE